MFLEHIGLYARDTEELAQWYQDHLHLGVERKLDRGEKPSIYFLQSDRGAQIEILPTDVERKQSEEPLKEPGYSNLGLVVEEDFEDVKSELEESGIELWGVRETSNGWTIGYLNDPEGNIIELVHR